MCEQDMGKGPTLSTTSKSTYWQARTQDFENGGSEYRVAIRPRRGGGCGRGSFYTMDDLECQIFIQI